MVQYSVRALVTYFSGGKDSRAVPIASGYQPKFSVDGNTWSVEHEYASGQVVYPGDSVEVVLTFYKGAEPGDLYKGMSFELTVGEKVVGEATVMDVIT